jgi:hypothetical protein
MWIRRIKNFLAFALRTLDKLNINWNFRSASFWISSYVAADDSLKQNSFRRLNLDSWLPDNEYVTL